MAPLQAKPLQILNASAGSGKTYNLVLTYLRLILGEGRSAQTFAHIMAMTFTNKAALEMKTRIISALDLLSNPERKTNRETEKAKRYAEDVAKALSLSPAALRPKAKAALKQILHQYEDFHVMTIDKFNLRLIRSFSKDLDLPADFQIILNEDEVLDQVIDQILDGLDAKNRQKLTDLVLKYSREKLEDQEGWNFQRDLKSFAAVLTNEKYFPVLEELMNADYSTDAYKTLNTEISSIRELIENAAKALHGAFTQFDPSQLPGKSRTADAFNKLISDKLLDGNTTNEGFFSDTILATLSKDGAFPVSFAQSALEFHELYIRNITRFHLLRMIRKNFFNMALLQFISNELDGVKQTEQLIRISEFNKLISALIKDEEAPFIYERLGNRFRHFLLDEFQDTSRLQWMNIVPLVHESLSQNNENLIVGDPKQSIYRFKNGLAEQFVALPGIYNPEEDSFIAQRSAYFSLQGEKTPLKENWRSHKDIVRFNNNFFKTFRTQIPDSLSDFYADVEQEPRGSEGGYVFIHSQKIAEKEENGSLAMMLSWIDQCIADGIEKGDICILGNTKKDCNAWAIELTGRGHKVVSADSLLVHSDHYVKMTIAYLKWRKNPAGELEARRFSELYFSARSENSVAKIRSYWKTEMLQDDKQVQVFDTARFFVDEFGSEDLFFFPYENLYHLVQGFYALAGLEEIHNPYLHHLSDMVHDFDNQRGPELELFLDEYERNGKDSAIQIPENKDAIKIMTGHKSKGLEFPVVMLPNMDWSISSRQKKFLVREADNFIYTALSKNSKLESIKHLHDQEFNQSLLDKINLCYVMFTRPVERLYVANFCTAKPKEPRFGTYLHQVFSEMLHVPEATDLHILTHETDELTAEAGSPKPHDPEITSGTDASEGLDFTPVSLRDKLWFPDISLQKNALDEEESLSDPRRYGNQLHLLLSIITDAAQITPQLHALKLSGEIEAAFEDRLHADLQKIMDMPGYRELLQDATEILNEQGIITGPAETKRPDKIIRKNHETIVIDYKTGMPDAKHLKQVLTYVNTLRAMGFPEVRGVVFYTGELRLVRAESV